jgi:hypothetical protein
MSKHFIGMAGLHGYMPSCCDVYQTPEDAAESLGSIHELEDSEIEELVNDWYLELDLHERGNEYCEISVCECDEPWIHSDSMTEEEYQREYGEE